ncbi:MAG: HAD family phosphatase [Limnochordales bacterium]|nr:HAD family phosphatase [Limnochordales bacterium]
MYGADPSAGVTAWRWTSPSRTPSALVALDCDGTLLRSDASLSPLSVKVIKRLGEMGVAVTLATGRRFSAALPYARSLGLQQPLVLHNGALIAHPLTGETLRYLPLPREAAEATILLARTFDLDILLFSDPTEREGAGLIERMPRNPFDRRFVVESGGLIQEVADLLRALPARPLKLICAGPPESIGPFHEKLRAVLPSTGQQARTVLYNSQGRVIWSVEVLHAQASKAAGVAYVAHLLGLTLADVIAFGDDMNDYDLLASAGIGVAMENGAPELRQVAREVAPANDKDGVALVLARLFGLDAADPESQGR